MHWIRSQGYQKRGVPLAPALTIYIPAGLCLTTGGRGKILIYRSAGRPNGRGPRGPARSAASYSIQAAHR